MNAQRSRRNLRVFYAGTLIAAIAAVLVVAVMTYDQRLAEDGADGSVSASDASERAAKAEAGRQDGSADPRLLAPGSLWHPVGVQEVDASDIPAYKEVVEDRALVRLVHPTAPLAVGDRLSVVIPQLGETYRPVVSRVETGPGSTRSVAGQVTAADGSRHGFVYTVGPRSTFAHIGTPKGTFELVANRELGWLMPSANMDQHVDYSKPDYYIVRPNGPDRPSHALR